jgi:ABC-type sugar transport system permease subunit
MLNYRAFGLGHMGVANAIGIVTLVLVAVLCYGLMRTTLRQRRAAMGPAA